MYYGGKKDTSGAMGMYFSWANQLLHVFCPNTDFVYPSISNHVDFFSNEKKMIKSDKSEKRDKGKQ
jgi:hypothetical protein